MVKTIVELNELLVAAEEELSGLDAKRAVIFEQIKRLQHEIKLANQVHQSEEPIGHDWPLTSQSPPLEKITLFRSLFRGREDVYPRRFESRKTGKSGYHPACRNEWIKPLCNKPKMKCGQCTNREFLPVTDEVIKRHLLGADPEDRLRRDFTIGVYPLLTDETCWFLAVDFDKSGWIQDIAAFLETCQSYGVPTAHERSRSGNGGHVWIFFSTPVSVSLARQMGSFLLTETMERRPEIGLDSYDRFFPNQDTLPKGGFGNLIALPLQKKPREKGNSLFLDEDFKPYGDQWQFLSGIRRITQGEVEAIVQQGYKYNRIIGVKMVVSGDDEDEEPWAAPPSRRRQESAISGPLPEIVKIVIGHQLYIPKDGLTPALTNRLIRIAAFQNPEFYKAQAMRLPTFQIPRIIGCCEDFIKYLGLPRGCIEEVIELLDSLGIKSILTDERLTGNPINVRFLGILRDDQQTAARAMLDHDAGVLSAATAFGKTVVAAYIIAKRQVNTLVLVHRRQLLDQWVSRLGTFLGLDYGDIGQIGGGKRRQSGIVDVAVIQSLSKKGVVDDIVGEYGHIVVDECHHISAKSFEAVTRQCKAKYFTGLSATVTRKDGHHPIILMQCGPIRYRVDDRMQAVARSFKRRVILRKTEFKLPESCQDRAELTIHEIYSALSSDEGRNDMIIRDVLESVTSRRSPVILTERKEHLYILADRLAAHVRNVVVLKGGMGRKQRQAITDRLSKISDDEERIIIATGRYLGEGFDDARLDTLFLALPISWRGILAQYAGRLHRSHEKKNDVVVYDYADFNIPMLAKMYERRRRGYKIIGYKIEE